jgi:hypothetical protein
MLIGAGLHGSGLRAPRQRGTHASDDRPRKGEHARDSEENTGTTTVVCGNTIKTL